MSLINLGIQEKLKGFTIAEMLISLAILGVIIGSTIPVISTKRSTPGQEITSINCIQGESGTDTSTSNCISSKKYCKYSQNNACNTLSYLADHGSSDNRTKARKILWEVCNNGGSEACEYFVKSCQKDLTTCNIADSDYDLHYFLTLGMDSSNLAKKKVINVANLLYKSNNPNIVDSVNNACYENFNSSACSLLSEACTDPDSPSCQKICTNKEFCSNLVLNCNLENGNACKTAFDVYVNRSCKEILEKTNLNTSGSFKLSLSKSGSTIDGYCDMTTDGGGYTIVKIVDPTIYSIPDAYNTCNQIGMELIVPRTKDHAYSIFQFNNNTTPNVVGVFPKYNGAYGLSNWTGICQGNDCTFWMSKDNNVNGIYTGMEPNGDNTSHLTALTSYSSYYNIFNYSLGNWGYWNDAYTYNIDTGGALPRPGFVICSTNDK